jgi:Calpain family cysteine protease
MFCNVVEAALMTFLQDILDIDKFWNEELLHANKDRLFGCAFDDLDNSRNGAHYVTVNGLMGGHAYSVLRAVEYEGKRFVVIRNPWGNSEWTGPWSDGSKEWTPETLHLLKVLDHTFGNDGQFVMECQCLFIYPYLLVINHVYLADGDFLANWAQIDRVLLFDSSWVMSSQWLKVTTRDMFSAWTFGDVSCKYHLSTVNVYVGYKYAVTISLPAPSLAIIVLSQVDDRFFQAISGRARWLFDFVVFRKGETKPVTTSSYSRFYSRSVNAEVHLEAGDYVVHVRAFPS